MTLELTPRWKPLRFTAAERPLFDPVLVPERGALVTGSPDALHVFAIGDRASESFAVPARCWITGFAVSGGALYVQDGPVLACHDLTMRQLLCALNLLTGERWTPQAGSSQPPDSLYELDGDHGQLQAQLLAGRRAHAAALRQEPGADPPPALLAAAADARGIDFSPPVVRRQQIDGRRGAQVFSLRMDGLLLAMDAALKKAEAFATAAPLRPELVMAELPRPDGQRCHLYYVAADGDIAAIDGTGNMALLPGWPAKGPLEPQRVLPLRFEDGHLMGGGLLGHDFFVLRPDAAQPPVVAVSAPPGGWRSYDVLPADKLVVLSDGQRSRLTCYKADALVRDRWQLRDAGAAAASLFWAGAGGDGLPAGPALALEVDEAPQAGTPPRLRVLLANNIDPARNDCLADFPPQSQMLETAVLTPGNWASQMPPIVSWPCKPTVAQQTLFCVYAGQGNEHAVAAFALGSLYGVARPKADEQLAAIRRLLRRIPVRLTESTTHKWGRKSATREPLPLTNTRTMIVPSTGEPTPVTTDGDGVFLVDPSWEGLRVTVDLRYVNLTASTMSCNPTVIVAGRMNTLQVDLTIFYAAPDQGATR